ncbi:MAG: hypothetical protein OXC60_03970 [Litoreibacter sp.]|nr:hypothetical protein [Litoreibacter sp.]MCY4333813.1 hypothetical protein [Litoreibacter sp.]
MRALIVHENPTFQTNLSYSLMQQGFHTLTAMDIYSGLAFARRGSLDLLILSEVIEDELAHSVALSAERHSPYVSTIILTKRQDEDVHELYELLPSLYSILGHNMPLELIKTLGVAGLTGANLSVSSNPLALPKPSDQDQPVMDTGIAFHRASERVMELS